MNFGKINFRKYRIWGIFMRPLKAMDQSDHVTKSYIYSFM